MLLPAVIKTIKQGGVGVLPTDTLYGLVASVFSKKAVERVYRLKNRNPKKPLIILIASMQDLKGFRVLLDKTAKSFLKQVWPGKVSVILPLNLIGQNKVDRTSDRTITRTAIKDNLSYRLSYLKPLHNTLAFRLPKPIWLRQVLGQTGPLVAPSCNPEGLEPAQTIRQAKQYFSDKVDFYFNKGRLWGSPSTLVAAQGGVIKIIRQGAEKLKTKNERKK